MRDKFLRLVSHPEILSLYKVPGDAHIREPERSQFSHLLRHFLERFFNHETASADGDAKTRMVQIAFAVGLPGFVVALYLWPDYHSFIPYWRDNHLFWFFGPPPYWAQVNQHFFFLVYSFVAMGIVAVFEWDLFFPDLLDIFVLNPLPISGRETFLARVSAIVLLFGGFLFDANVLATLVLPVAIDPPNLPRFLIGHILACGLSGLFAAVSILAFECIVLSILGDRLFRSISLFVQGFLVSALLLTLLLFPVFSEVVPHLLQSGSWYVRCIPPLWFLGIYQRFMEGSAAIPIYGQLAQTGFLATLVVFAIAASSYPFAYFRKTRQLVEGLSSHQKRSWTSVLILSIAEFTAHRAPGHRAIFHYVTQTLFRVPRYRIYLVLYGGVGLSIVVSNFLRFSTVHDQIQVAVSSDGLRASTGIVAFWAVAGLRLAFLSPGNQQGSWVFHIVHGRPTNFDTALEQLGAVKSWAFLFVATLTGSAFLAGCVIAPPELLTWREVIAQILVAIGFAVLLTDLFFFSVTTVAFTDERREESPSLAISVAKYFTFFPLVLWLSFVSGPWIEARYWRYIVVSAGLAAAHWLIKWRHREVVRQHCQHFDPDNCENLFLLRLALRD